MENLLYVILAIIIIFMVTIYRVKIINNKHNGYLQNIFKETNLEAPKLSISSGYDWPRFEIIFSSKKNFLLAKREGTIELFKQYLATCYKPPFDPNAAVACIYPGIKDEWLKQSLSYSPPSSDL